MSGKARSAVIISTAGERLAEVSSYAHWQPALELWASGDICHHLSITRTTLKRWRVWPDFPTPIAQVSRGTVDVWDGGTVRAWHDRACADGRVKSK